ncbi:DUF447 domain-containing protein [Planctomycetes bacterium K23_9]|uniref:DUF447 family protein n=1 Tax=Stieleria marina TaxID=1930275 RepID=A0A517P0R8_9BACT|nr:hypothetical protein K239x_49790 [Planctomycetes bacterium K23_9]
MILESIVTTVDLAGRINIAPMGPTVAGDWESPEFLLRPFSSSRTYANLQATNHAVIHVTDDVQLFAKAAVDAIDDLSARDLVRSIQNDAWWILNDCHRWFAVEIESKTGQEPRIDMHCRIVHSGVERPFFGFNRAKHAVIEAAILATRTHLIAADEIADQIARLTPLVEKTAGESERAAFAFLCETIDQRTSER